MSDVRAVITGIGLVSSLGTGTEEHMAAIKAAKPVHDAGRHAPYTVHPVPEIDWTAQMQRRDQRQMELWQKLGVFGSGLALDDAGMKDDLALCGTMDMIVAASGGERDLEVDAKILSQVEDTNDAGKLINDVLMTDLRPTLFLAQLSNLLAGNISIVHKVTGSSRTFMGEESASVSALRSAVERIRHGQSTHALVGGSFNGEDADFLLSFELAGLLSREPWKPVMQRTGNAVMTGSGAAFLVLESEAHAKARGATILAELGRVAESRVARTEAYPAHLAKLYAQAGLADADIVFSAAHGEAVGNAAEASALDGKPVRTPASLTGFTKEALFFFNVALAALAVSRDEPIGPFTPDEQAAPAARAALATSIGYGRGEGAVLVRRYGA